MYGDVNEFDECYRSLLDVFLIGREYDNDLGGIGID